jgi:hypothetical protein
MHSCIAAITTASPDRAPSGEVVTVIIDPARIFPIVFAAGAMSRRSAAPFPEIEDVLHRP